MTRSIKRLRKFWLLDPADRTLLLLAWVGLSVIRLGLLCLSFRTLRRWLTKLLQLQLHFYAPKPATTVHQIVWAVETASRVQIGGTKCLARALITQYLLMQHGYSAHLRIGVAKSSIGQLEAHAWVEYQGEVVIGALQQLSSFTPLPALEFGNKG